MRRMRICVKCGRSYESGGIVETNLSHTCKACQAKAAINGCKAIYKWISKKKVS